MPPPSDEHCANPLLLSWVKEWLDLARERNTKGVTTYKNAYNSLRVCPITFTHPCQLQELKGFGPKLCDRLTDKLKKHCEENGLPMPAKRRRNTASATRDGADGDDDDEEDRPRPAKKPRTQKAYVPKLRSGAYAIILGLSEHNASGTRGLTKEQLIEAAQPHCDTSFTAPPDPSSFYTAWNSVKTLINKELVIEKRGPKRYYVLSDDGRACADAIKKTMNPSHASVSGPGTAVAGASAQRQNPALEAILTENPSAKEPIMIDDDDCDEDEDRSVRNESTSPKRSKQIAPSDIDQIISGPQPVPPAFVDVVPDSSSSNDPTAIPNFQPIRLRPGSFDVRLVLDVREIRAKTDRDYMQEELSKRGVDPLVRSCELGDVLWVAKCHDPTFLSRTGAEGDEVVLDWIVERKRLDDLIGSIKDGRFKEQKYRLDRSGVRHVVYVVEDMALNPHTAAHYEEHVQSAMASTQVVNGYFLKRTQRMDDTIRYLTRMTRRLRRHYESRPLLVIPTGVITAQNYRPLLDHLRARDPDNGYYVSYPAFMSLASKSEMMTLRDQFLKQLMCTRGLTGEKALEIQKRWKTPAEFIKAFQDAGLGAKDEEESKKRKGEMVFGQLGGLFGRRQVQKKLSQKIAEIWGGG